MLTLLRRKSVLVGLSLLPLLGAIILFGLLARRHVADRGAVPTDLHPPATPVVVIRNFTYSRTFRSQTRWFVIIQSQISSLLIRQLANQGGFASLPWPAHQPP